MDDPHTGCRTAWKREIRYGARFAKRADGEFTKGSKSVSGFFYLAKLIHLCCSMCSNFILFQVIFCCIDIPLCFFHPSVDGRLNCSTSLAGEYCCYEYLLTHVFVRTYIFISL